MPMAALRVSVALGAAFAALADEAKAGRRLGRTACLWDINRCDLDPAYIEAKAAGLPQGGPFPFIVKEFHTCAAAYTPAAEVPPDAVAHEAEMRAEHDIPWCKTNPACDWDKDVAGCVPKAESLTQALMQALFDPATCGESGRAKEAATRARCSQGFCEGGVCHWTTDSVPTSTNTCTHIDRCGLIPADPDMMRYGPMCPSSFLPDEAFGVCADAIVGQDAEKLKVEAIALQVRNCTLKGCPLMAHIEAAQMQAYTTCTPLRATTCTANPNCFWDGATCFGNVDVTSLALQDVPDTCQLKGIILALNACSRALTQVRRQPKASCTGHCLWQPIPTCVSDQFSAPMGCAPRPGLLNEMLGMPTGGPQLAAYNDVIKATFACRKMTNKPQCETTEANGATGMFRHQLLAGPLFLLAVSLVSAGL